MSLENNAPRVLLVGVKIQQAGTLFYRKAIHSAILNVGTLLKIGDHNITTRMLHDCHVYIAVILGVHLPYSGFRCSKVPGANVFSWFHHSQSENALLLRESISFKFAITQSKRSSRIMTAIIVRVSTNVADDAAKDDFYDTEKLSQSRLKWVRSAPWLLE